MMRTGCGIGQQLGAQGTAQGGPAGGNQGGQGRLLANPADFAKQSLAGKGGLPWF